MIKNSWLPEDRDEHKAKTEHIRLTWPGNILQFFTAVKMISFRGNE